MNAPDHHPATRPSIGATGRRPARNRRRGTILLIVLGTILVLSALITAFLDITRKEIVLRGMYVGRESMRLTAWSAFESTIAVLNTYLQIDGGLYGPNQGWGDPLNQKAWGNSTASESGNTAVIYAAPNGMTINVTITDLTGLMPINRMSDNEFLAMFDSMGVDPSQGQSLLDVFRDWTQPYTGNFTSDGAGPDYYETLSPGYDPTYTNITDFDEFRYLKDWKDLFWDEKGTETPLYQQFRSMVTLHDSGGGVNLNTASTAVLDMLADQYLTEIDEPTLESYLWGADGVPNTPDDMMIRNSSEETTAGVLSTATGNSTTGGNTTGGAAGGSVTGANTSATNNSPVFAALAAGGGGGGGATPGGNGGGGATPGGSGGAPRTGGATPGGNGGGGATPGGSGGAARTGGATPGGGAAGGGGAGATTGGAKTGTGSTTGTTSATSTNVGVGFQARLLKINIVVTLGDSNFLLSTIVKPNNYGTGVPTSVSGGGGAGSGGFTATTTNTTGAYPFSIVSYAENYDIP